MKKILYGVFFLLFFNLYALEVVVDEIKGVKAVEFINYSGPYKKVESIRSIRNIGYQLSFFEKENEVFRYHMKYSILHAVDNTNDERYDADIFSIDKDAEIDHIKNVRLIISEYLSKRYGYPQRISDSLALFITYYNAIFRGDINYFKNKYKDNVTKHINKDNAGISTKYYEWPGRTKILIPLSQNISKKDILQLSYSELSEQKVLDEIRKDNNAIADRKEMVKLREKDLLDEKRELEKIKKEVDKEKIDIEKKKEEIIKNKEEIIKKEEELKKENMRIETILDKNLKTKSLENLNKEKEKLENKKIEVEKKEKEIEKKEDKIQQKMIAINEAEKKVEEKEKGIVDEKNKIKQDEKDKKTTELSKAEELKKKEDELRVKEEELKKISQDKKIYEDKFYYLKTEDFSISGHYNNKLFIIDAESIKVLLKSPVEKICGNKYLVTKEGVIVITYKTNHDSDHILTLLDLNSLEIKKNGNDNIYFRSFVEEYENFIYAIIKNGDDYYLGKFNKLLDRIAISDEKIDFSTFITFYKNFIYLNNSKKEIIVLNISDLKKVAVVNF